MHNYTYSDGAKDWKSLALSLGWGFRICRKP